jgi:hypothetical protein
MQGVARTAEAAGAVEVRVHSLTPVTAGTRSRAWWLRLLVFFPFFCFSYQWANTGGELFVAPGSSILLCDFLFFWVQ